MKITEYIHDVSTLTDSDILNETNIINIKKYEKMIKNIQNIPNSSGSESSSGEEIFLQISEDFLYHNNINEIFNNLNNKIIYNNNVDIDFPPPVFPYYYDKYFDKKLMPENAEEISYYDKINNDLIQIMEKNNLYVVTHSPSIFNPRIIHVPLGISESFHHFRLKTNEKAILCYANFGLPCDRWFGNPRKQILDIICNKDFILKETQNMNNYDNFFEKISKSKFTICPRGCGIDTYRLWDCICLGSIPIVEKYDGHKNLKNLPILFLDDMNDYNHLTEEKLNQIFDDFMMKDFDYSQLFTDHLPQMINDVKKTLEKNSNNSVEKSDYANVITNQFFP